MTAQTQETVPDGPDSAAREKLIRELTYEVTLSHEPPYYELKIALDVLICKINNLPCADPTVDWPAIISEALVLRPKHGD